ncbi:DUF1329 domain-containing protein [Immundisolibacter sp.]|uniref:DUF1329 domain-containing protein n=1 Tax=Immundisolibacter sp. TaxID=1934948 RepID=UPI00260376F4|nr:DUF1329 domain-containing protein [Immundisolibacter sp.]MDD3650052.1 DUF1329 domain-containing protein [Immundisolibacter sp.]
MTIRSFVAVISLFTLSHHYCRATELTEGTVIKKENIETYSNDTFEGHPISDLIPSQLQVLVKKYGLQMTLTHSKPIVVAQYYIDATTKNAPHTSLDLQSRKVQNYVAGVPFPNVETSDPNAAMKLIWNQFYVAPVVGDVQEVGNIQTYTTTAASGIERTFVMRGGQFRMEGRVSGGPPTLGDGTIHKLQCDYFVAPRDSAGVGVFQMRYNDGRPDSVWAYVKSARRIRRMSGGSWMDPTGSLDFLNDDSFLLNSYPLWYSEYRYLGKRWILAVVHQPARGQGLDSSTRYDFKNPPHWNPTGIMYEPREVHVIEAIPPKEHPYSKKVLYMEADPNFPHFYWGEFYDKKNEIWRIMWHMFGGRQMADGQPGFYIASMGSVDVQRERATVLDLIPDEYILNRPGASQQDFRPEVLKEAAEGKMKGE